MDIRQISSDLEVKESRLKNYYDKVVELKTTFKEIDIQQVPQELNQRAEELAKGPSSGEYNRKSSISQDIIKDLRVAEEQRVSQSMFMVKDQEETWVDFYTRYLKDIVLPIEKTEARHICKQAFNYPIMNGKLYRKLVTGPLLRCLMLREATKLMEEIHEGFCGKHSGGRNLAHKALSASYFWPYMMTEAWKFIQKCDRYQKFAPVSHSPIDPLHSITL